MGPRGHAMKASLRAATTTKARKGLQMATPTMPIGTVTSSSFLTSRASVRGTALFPPFSFFFAFQQRLLSVTFQSARTENGKNTSSSQT